MRRALHALLAGVLLARFSAEGSEVRLSFLTDDSVLRDTLEMLRRSGCREDSVTAFRKIVAQHNATPVEVPFSNLPIIRDGFFSFESAPRLVSALEHRLSDDIMHRYDFNCIDTVILLGDGLLRNRLRPDDNFGPFLVLQPQTNDLAALRLAATASDAFTTFYPPWYLETTKGTMKESMQADRVCLTAALFSCHLLPKSTSEQGLNKAVLNALSGSWRHQGFKFPSKFEVVLVHGVNYSGKMVVTFHSGLLFSRKRGYTYLEKAGGKGPFVRLDFEARTDLTTWLAAMSQGAENMANYTHRLATFNDKRIESLDVKP
ncbi:MAG: DUF4300 family protein [Verrucomicrobia bacterium]|nr:DUF4300 family protein [Verrucomicrobiota bacterium]